MTTSGEHNLGITLVTGGSGGLASQIFELFSQRGCTHLHSIDLRQSRHHLDNVMYHDAETEVLSQSRTPGAPFFLTCAIRPSGIFGIGDPVVIPGILDAYYKGKTWVQFGSSELLFDLTENTNVAHAHYLAAVGLAKQHEKQLQPPSHEKIDGEAFFITDDEPRCFWDFARSVWRYAGDNSRPEDVWTITRPWAFLLAEIG